LLGGFHLADLGADNGPGLRYNDPLLERRGGVKIKHRHYPQNAEVVDIEGEIDYNTSPNLRAELQKILE